MVFLVLLKVTPDAQAGKINKSSKMFKVEDASIVMKSQLSALPGASEVITKADSEHEKIPKEERMKENLFLVLIVCGPHINLMPCYWNWDDLQILDEDRMWKDIFLRETSIAK